MEHSDSENRKPKMTSRDIALYLGYDLTTKEDLSRLQKNVEWVDEHRVKDERREAARPPFVVGAFLAILTGLVTVGATWFLHIFGL